MAHFQYSEILAYAQHSKNRPRLPQRKKQTRYIYHYEHGFIQHRPYLLLVGFGDIARRITQQVGSSVKIIALSRKRPPTQNVLWKYTDLDTKSTLSHHPSSGYIGMVYLAPPPAKGNNDPRLQRFLLRLTIKRAVYLSTTGVYGHHPNTWIDETQPSFPLTDRAKRRKNAERTFRTWAKAQGTHACILRVPGIYAHNRLPIERIQHHIPALIQTDDVYTNHIHADDLARLVWKTLFQGKTQRIYNACDDTHLKMGDYFDQVAQAFGLAYPPRLNRFELSQQLTPLQYSFMQESRCIQNHRIKKELGFRFRYPNLESWIHEAI